MAEAFTDRNYILSVLFHLVNGRVPVSVLLGSSGAVGAYVEKVELGHRIMMLTLASDVKDSTVVRKEASVEALQFNPRLKFTAKIMEIKRSFLVLSVPGRMESADMRACARARILQKEDASMVALFGMFDGIGVLGGILDIGELGCAIGPTRAVDAKTQQAVEIREYVLREMGPNLILRLTYKSFRDLEMGGKFVYYFDRMKQKRMGISFDGVPKPLRDQIRNVVQQRTAPPSFAIYEFPKSGVIEKKIEEPRNVSRPGRVPESVAPPKVEAETRPRGQDPANERNGKTPAPDAHPQVPPPSDMAQRGLLAAPELGAPASKASEGGAGQSPLPEHAKAVAEKVSTPASVSSANREVAATAPPALAMGEKAKRFRAVVIDYPEDVQDFKSVMGEHFPHVHCQPARNYLEGAQLVRAIAPDLVVSDLLEPVESVIRELSAFKNTRVVILAKSVTKEDLLKLVMAGFREVLIKPIDIDRMRKLIPSE